MIFNEYKATVTISNTENWLSHEGLERIQWAAGVLLGKDIRSMPIPQLTLELVERMRELESEIDVVEDSEIVRMANKIARDFEDKS